MKNIITIETKTTPNITFDNGVLTISGKSIPFESEMFWALNIHQIKKYNVKKVNINLEYINTTSIQHLIKLLKHLNVDVTWFYDEFDYDMLELGKDLKLFLNNLIVFENKKHKFIC